MSGNAFENMADSAKMKRPGTALERQTGPKASNTCRGGEDMPFEHDYGDSGANFNEHKTETWQSIGRLALSIKEKRDRALSKGLLEVAESYHSRIEEIEAEEGESLEKNSMCFLLSSARARGMTVRDLEMMASLSFITSLDDLICLVLASEAGDE